MSGLRILVAISNPYLPQVIGGAEWAAHTLVVRLQQRGHKVAVLSGLKAHDLRWLQHGLQRHLLRRPFSVDRAMGYPVYRVWDPKDVLEQFAERYQPDVVIIDGSGSEHSMTAFSHLDLRCPTIVMIHNVEFPRNHEHVLRLKRATFVANSRFTAQRLKDAFDIDAFVMHPIVDLAACRVEAPGSKVVMVNPTHIKGVATTLALAQARPEIPFVIQESWGRSKEEMVRRVAALKNVELRAPTLDPRTFFRDARILLVPSVWDEAWGRVVTEAHFSGIPVLGSNAGALPESIGPGGILVDRNAALDDWISAFDQMWNDRRLWKEMSFAARQYSMRKEVDAASQVSFFETLLWTLVGSKVSAAGEREDVSIRAH